jgi:16S rRNA (guanine527-N7)-methyltransferase
MQTILSQALQENGYSHLASCQPQFLDFLTLMQKWNRVFNLTAIDTPKDMVYLHILDSLTLLPFLHGQTFLDVGSGGGLPGIPLAIAEPNKKWVLLDKSQKKTRFLRQVIAELNLQNVAVACSRVEDFKSEAGFDSIVSRAFGTIALLIQSTQHLLVPDGQFLAMKGGYPEQEIVEIPVGFTLMDVNKLTIKGLAAERHLVRIVRGQRD